LVGFSSNTDKQPAQQEIKARLSPIPMIDATKMTTGIANILILLSNIDFELIGFGQLWFKGKTQGKCNSTTEFQRETLTPEYRSCNAIESVDPR
jgi:hypothetical protein